MSAIKNLLNQAYSESDNPRLRMAGQEMEVVTNDLLGLLARGGRDKRGSRPVEPRTGFVIDPIAVTKQLSRAVPGSVDAKVEEMAAQVFLLQQMIADERIRQYNQGIAFNATPAEQRRAAQQLAVALPQDVVYKRSIRGGPKGVGTQVEFATFADTPMLDWDVADPSHPQEAVTIDNLGDVEELVRGYQKDNPHSNMRIYQTPGGFRAFEFGHNPAVGDYQRAYRQMNVDPLYASLGMRDDRIGRVNDPAGYRSRLSHKPGRTDWVAMPIAELRGSDPRLSRRSQQIVEVMHDQPIRQAYLNDPAVRAAAMQAIEGQVPGASQELQRQIRNRLKLF
jgi:hypothetical protein